MTPLTPKARDPIPALSDQEVAVLKAARQLITEPSRWTQRTLGRDRHGNPIDFTSSRATCFCFSGAINLIAYKAYGLTDGEKIFVKIFTAVRIAVENKMDDDRATPVMINDDEINTAEMPEDWRLLTPHQRILSAMDMVISNAEQ